MVFSQAGKLVLSPYSSPASSPRRKEKGKDTEEKAEAGAEVTAGKDSGSGASNGAAASAKGTQGGTEGRIVTPVRKGKDSDSSACDDRDETSDSAALSTKGKVLAANPGRWKAGAGASVDKDVGEECPICFDLLVDPLSPCPEQLAHRCCRLCVEKMREHGLPACPFCRAPMQDAEELYYQSMQLHLRAERATGEAKTGLQRQCFNMLRRVVEVDPHHTGAMCNLGDTYDRGEGVEKDAMQAVHWYRKAAVQGGAEAQCSLGFMYSSGEGVETDAVQAVHWWRKAAEQGHAKSQYNLGVMYDNGEGVQQNSHEAARWWQMAADQGHVRAHFNLGILNER